MKDAPADVLYQLMLTRSPTTDGSKIKPGDQTQTTSVGHTAVRDSPPEPRPSDRPRVRPIRPRLVRGDGEGSARAFGEPGG
jgi:hypothetical protein